MYYVRVGKPANGLAATSLRETDLLNVNLQNLRQCPAGGFSFLIGMFFPLRAKQTASLGPCLRGGAQASPADNSHQKADEPFRCAQIAQYFELPSILTLLKARIGIIIVVCGEPLQCPHNFFPQRFAVGQPGKEMQLSPQTDRFDPDAPLFNVDDPPSIQPRMGCFMDDGGSDSLDRHRLPEHVAFVDDAGVQ